CPGDSVGRAENRAVVITADGDKRAVAPGDARQIGYCPGVTRNPVRAICRGADVAIRADGDKGASAPGDAVDEVRKGGGTGVMLRPNQTVGRGDNRPIIPNRDKNAVGEGDTVQSGP